MTSKRGVLIRTIPVRLLNVSASGFLLESQQRINAGTTGILDVDAGTTRYLSPANLLRAVHRPGAGQTFHVGGMFTPSTAAARRPTHLPSRRSAPVSQPPRAARPPHTSAA